jgi:hypothetical protein
MSDKWQQIIADVLDRQARISQSGSVPWYRGHASSTWEARSSLHRHVKEQFVVMQWDDPKEMQEHLRDEYQSLYCQFRSDAWPLLGPDERSDWAIVFSMQHHGFPTRLLDWTESFACALYFAQSDRKEDEEAAIYVLDPTEANKANYGVEGLIALEGESRVPANFDIHRWLPNYVRQPDDQPLRTIAVTPFMSNPRMIAQRAAFTVCGDSFQPLEQELAGCIAKISLPPETFADAEKFLNLVGVEHFGYFPDFEGLRKKFHEKKTKELRALKELL